MENNGAWLLGVVCCTPFVLGVVTGVIGLARVIKLGWWGLLPFGGTFKEQWEEKKG